MMNLDEQRIKTTHRERKAIVYVRQSSPDQVRDNVESRRVQLGLRERAVALGWYDPIVIQDDLGISASGYAERQGFQRMLTEVTMRHVGLILSLNASRLSRNSKDWAHLFELCGYFDTLVADLDQVYDLSIPNDRLVLGIKGTIAEMELTILKNRLRSGSESKAARGELKFIVPPGYSHDLDGRIILEPDIRVREAISDMFVRFDRCTSIRQLSMWYRDTKTIFPVRKIRKTQTIAWEIPTVNNLRKLLAHPIYAGAYVYGRRNTRIEYVDGKLVRRFGGPVPPEKCRVFIPDHHPGYITWEKYKANQVKISDARPRWDMQQNRGAIRDGLALLSGILRCGHCGRKIFVTYKQASALYYCDGGQAKGTRRCQSFGSKMIDRRVSEELLKALEPLALEASQVAQENQEEEQRQRIRQVELQVQEAQYEADRAFEQYDLVDPRNRLVADTLEQRFNEKLVVLQEAKTKLEQCRTQIRSMTEEEREQIKELGHNATRLWDHPDALASHRKRIIRAAIEEVIVLHKPESQSLEVTIHWKGDMHVHTQLTVKKRVTPVGSKADESLVELVRKLSDSLGDAEVARILNMQKRKTPRGHPWTQDRVCNFRRHHKIRQGCPKEDPDFLTGQKAAEYLGISRNGLTSLIKRGDIKKTQITDFAPWRIARSELDSERVQELVRVLKATGRLPKSGGCPENQASLFPMKSIKIQKEAL